MIQINACVYCGRKAQGNYSVHRDGVLNGLDVIVPLCDDCGSDESPSLCQIWARISLVKDNGQEWGPSPHECQRVERFASLDHKTVTT